MLVSVGDREEERAAVGRVAVAAAALPRDRCVPTDDMAGAELYDRHRSPASVAAAVEGTGAGTVLLLAVAERERAN